MGRAKRRPVEIEEEDELDEETIARDAVMARLAGARASLQASIESVDECLTLFVNPADDKSGKERKELLESALEAVGCASRGLESAVEGLPDIDPTEGEPWDDDEEDDDDD